MQLQPATDNVDPETRQAQKRELSSISDQRTSKRRRTTSVAQEHVEWPPLQDEHVTLMHHSRRVGTGPWATAAESVFYDSAAKT